jgi:hypothetical protein
LFVPRLDCMRMFEHVNYNPFLMWFRTRIVWDVYFNLSWIYLLSMHWKNETCFAWEPIGQQGQHALRLELPNATNPASKSGSDDTNFNVWLEWHGRKDCFTSRRFPAPAINPAYRTRPESAKFWPGRICILGWNFAYLSVNLIELQNCRIHRISLNFADFVNHGSRTMKIFFIVVYFSTI